jgi:hypothetical protein
MFLLVHQLTSAVRWLIQSPNRHQLQPQESKNP